MLLFEITGIVYFTIMSRMDRVTAINIYRVELDMEIVWCSGLDLIFHGAST